MRKTAVVVSIILLNTVIALAAAFLIFGVSEQIFIGDKMPPVDHVRLRITVFKNLSIIFSMLTAIITIFAVPEIIILRKIKMLRGKEFFVTILFWVIPLIACYIKLAPQFAFTY